MSDSFDALSDNDVLDQAGIGNGSEDEGDAMMELDSGTTDDGGIDDGGTDGGTIDDGGMDSGTIDDGGIDDGGIDDGGIDDGGIDDGGIDDGGIDDGGIDDGGTSETETAHLFFASGFEDNVTISKPADASSKSWSLNGADLNSTAEVTDWSLLNSDSDFARFSLRSIPEANAEYDLVPDPLDPSNTVFMLHTKTQQGEGSTVRSQGSMNFTNLETPPTQLYTRFRWHIGVGLEALKDMNRHAWMYFFEAYSENIAACPGGPVCNGAGGQRIVFYFEEEGDTDVFRWALDVFDTEGEEQDQQADVRLRNNSVPVPFGSWITLEVFIRQGENPTIDGTSDATIVIALQVNDGPWQELFHLTDARIGGIDNTPGLRFFEPFKNYMNSANLAFLGNLDGANGIADTRMYYDDFEVWDSCPLDSHCKTLED